MRGRAVIIVALLAAAADARPRVKKVAPEEVAPGARVEVIGRGFEPGDQVTLGEVALEVVEVGPSRIVAVVPEGASSGRIHLVRGGKKHRGPKLAVRAAVSPYAEEDPPSPPPKVKRANPSRAAPGERVEIAGKGFREGDRVLLGDREMEVVSANETAITAVVPDLPPGRAKVRVAREGVESRALRFKVLQKKAAPSWVAPAPAPAPAEPSPAPALADAEPPPAPAPTDAEPPPAPAPPVAPPTSTGVRVACEFSGGEVSLAGEGARPCAREATAIDAAPGAYTLLVRRGAKRLVATLHVGPGAPAAITFRQHDLR